MKVNTFPPAPQPIHLLIPAHRKRRRFLTVKRAKSEIRTPLLLQLHISGNHIYDIIFRSYFFYNLI